MARPEAKIDLVELEKLCGMQCTDEEIAAFFGVSTRTIERRRKVEKFREVMDNAREPMKNSSNFAPLLKRPCLLDEIDQELAARRLGDFVRQAWHVVEPSTLFVPGWHIDAIIEHLEAVSRGQIRNLLINVPPRHMKSLLAAVFWPAGEWIRWPERRCCYGTQLSIRDSISAGA
jgi:hypothetical protein